MKNEIINNDALTVRVNTEAVSDAVEAGVEAVEDVAETVVTITKNNPYLVAGVAVVALTVGAAVGYKYAEHRLQTKFDQLVIDEIDKTRDFYKRVNKEGEYATPESTAEALGVDPAAEALGVSDPDEAAAAKEAVEALRTYKGDSPVNYNKPQDAEQESVVVNNIFVNNQPLDEDSFDYDTEVAKRDPDYPYIITSDEFFQNEPDHEQVQITYYAGDDVLVDEQQRPIPDEDVVGAENLKFGHGSKDANLVYIRSEKLSMDFEVCRSEASYSEEILGLRHADEPRRSMRFPKD